MAENYFGLIGIIIGITNITIGLLVFLNEPKRLTSKLWLFFEISVSVWGFGAYIISTIQNPITALLFWRLTHIGIIIIPFSLLIFSYSFLEKKNKTLVISSIIGCLFFLILDTTHYFIASTQLVFNSFYYDRSPTFLYDLFVLVFILIFIIIVSISLKEYFQSKDKIKKRQIFYFLLATIIGSIGGSTSFLPVYGINLYPYLNVTIIFFPLIIGYGILRYKLFDLKIIASELLIFIIWMFIFLRVLLSVNSTDRYINLILFAIMICIGTLLIRSIRNEARQKESIQKLANELKDLDELKSEFISLATHHISSPLTAIKGYVSLLQEDDGDNSLDSKEVLNTVQRLTNNTVTLVKDFLDVNRIEEGKAKFNPTSFYIAEFVNQIIVEYKPIILKNNLEFNYIPNTPKDIVINADRESIKLAITNLLDNSIKYSSDGRIVVETHINDNHFLMTITDNGVRNLPTISPRLFKKLSQSGNSDEANIIGNGLGVYAAKLLIEANHGKLSIKIDSSGETIFCIELLIKTT